MSKLAALRAEAARLYEEELLTVEDIAERMDRSIEGATLLLLNAGVDLDAPRAPRLPPAVVEPAEAAAPGACPPVEPSGPAATTPTAPDMAAVLVASAAACGEDAAADTLPVRVKVLAATVLVRGGWARPVDACARVGVAHSAQVAPSQIEKYGVTPDMIAAVLAYLRDGAELRVFPDERPGVLAAALKAARVEQLKQLYLVEGLSLEEAGKRLDLPVACQNVHRLLAEAGVDTRPRGTQGAHPGHRSDGEPRKPPRLPDIVRRANVRTSAPPPMARLKPVNERIVGWSRAYARRGVSADFLAYCFNVVEVEDLVLALEAAA
jgi:hypothetical protein